MSCYHLYGIIFDRSILKTRLVYRPEEIEAHHKKSWEYPHWPQSLEQFKFCPRCGEQLPAIR